MEWLLYIILVPFGLFSFVVFFGAPYLPTLRRQITSLFEAVEMKPGQTLLELGSGDGRLLAAAASRGIYAVGYELNPLLVLYSRIRWWRYRRLMTVHWGNYWRSDWPKADVVYVFLLQKYMKKLHERLADGPPLTLVSFAFTIPGVAADKTVNGLHVYSIGERL